MHIPDGFLDRPTAIASGGLALAGLAIGLAHAGRRLPRRHVPLLGLAAAFVFAAQMLNFPVAGGTSGHLIGSVLVAALLGPAAAVVVLSAVLIVQCFMFADGGITALGANVLNMAIIASLSGWCLYALIIAAMPGLRGRIVAGVVAGWFSTVVASIACAGELAASHTVAWSVALPAMGGIHMLIGVGEGLITGLVLAAIGKARPDLLGLASPRGFEVLGVSYGDTPPRATPTSASGIWTFVGLGLVISLAMALFVAPHACSWPDGLDTTAEVLGFTHKESEHRALPAMAADYRLAGIESEGLAVALAGAVGMVVVFGLGLGLAWVLSPRPRNIPEPAPLQG